MPSVKVVDSYARSRPSATRRPSIHTPTVDEVGDIAEIDTRDPHDTMHDEDLADVVGKEPVVLLFATPALCVSRVCGPVVDIAEQVKAEQGDDAAFIHMEIYNDNDPNKGMRPQLVELRPRDRAVAVRDRRRRAGSAPGSRERSRSRSSRPR